ncbi:S-layer homology domain-containing protein [Oscillospiraceae bacterium OttesenSCG-928-G22]|nr:S-layer homology domain-containing protein [Oscillospiraceae bacterium OttesenSCG-928-G22]
MSNLKKVLSLGLVLVMAFGLFLTAGAVSYTDEAEIKNKTEVKLLGDLEIMAGFPDGTFRGSESLTRAQVAKMVYVARTGGVDDGANAFKGATNVKFSDVYVGHWAEGYINYASSNGFVAGRGQDAYGNIRFYPEDIITGAEFIKIMLGALGYDPVKEGFQDTADWALNVVRVAKEVGMLDGYDGDTTQAITRDEAALIMANMIFCSTVAYDQNWNIVRDQPQFGEKYLRLVELGGILTDNEHAGLASNGLGEAKSYIANIPIFSDLGNNGNTFGITLEAETPIDLIGQHVTAYVRLNNGYSAKDLQSNSSASRAVQRVYGEITATPDMNKIIMSTPGDFTDESGYNADRIYGSNGFFVNFSKVAGANAAAQQAVVAALPRGNSVKLISNDGDSRIDIALATNYTFAKVTNVNASGKVTLNQNMGSTLSDEKAVGIEGLEKDDYVIGYQVNNAGVGYSSSNSGKVILQEVEKSEGVMVPHYASTGQIVIEGTTYGYNNVPGNDFAGVDNDAAKAAFNLYMAGCIRENATFYAFNGYIMKYEAKSVSNYAYIVAGGESVGGMGADVYALLDTTTQGTYAINNVNSVSYTKWKDAGNTLAANLEGQIVKYSLTEDGKLNLFTLSTDGDYVYQATALDLNEDGTGSKRLYKAGNAFFKVDGTTNYYVDDSSVLFLQTATNTWKIYNGKASIPTINLPGATVAGGLNKAYIDITHMTNNNLVKAAVLSGITTKGAPASTYYAIVSPIASEDSGGNAYQSFYAFFIEDNEPVVKKLSTTGILFANPADAIKQVYEFTFSGEKVDSAVNVTATVKADGSATTMTGFGYVSQASGNTITLKRINTPYVPEVIAPPAAAVPATFEEVTTSLPGDVKVYTVYYTTSSTKTDIDIGSADSVSSLVNNEADGGGSAEFWKDKTAADYEVIIIHDSDGDVTAAYRFIKL